MPKTMKDARKIVIVTLTKDEAGDERVDVRIDYEVESDDLSVWRSLTVGHDELTQGQRNSLKNFLGQWIAKAVENEGL